MRLTKERIAQLKKAEENAIHFMKMADEAVQTIEKLNRERDRFILRDQEFDKLAEVNAKLRADINALNQIQEGRIKETMQTTETIYRIMAGLNKMAKDLYYYGERTPRP